jgi:hypothetical protein
MHQPGSRLWIIKREHNEKAKGKLEYHLPNPAYNPTNPAEFLAHQITVLKLPLKLQAQDRPSLMASTRTFILSPGRP